ncbi:MAG: DUF3363 domain-containing protein [Alphaproteobacteria bacterium]|nr:DUF3363 domain-containing protein [Alphaproteobacteria bacterium]
MTTRENEFNLKLGRIGRDGGSSLASIRSAVRRSSKIASGPKTRLAPKTGLRAHFRKGSAGAARPVSSSQRRVVVKARYAVHGASRGAPLSAHVSYLAREGKQPGRGEPGLERSVDYLQRGETPGEVRYRFYDGGGEGLDGKAITAGWADDARHFRLIVSAEDGAALGDLKPMIREVMGRLETKLGTKLEWLAVDHWDTDNPHSHVLIRGVRADGQDLFIPSRLISHGIREHAQEVVTRVLGPRLDLDLAKERGQEIAHEGVTVLDRQLVAAGDGRGSLSIHRPDLIARLERLESWGLAERGPSGWRLADDLLGQLKSIEQRREVEQAISTHRRPGERLPLLEADRTQAIEGELVHLGPADDLGDSFLAVIETGRGELRYARIEAADDLAWLQDAAPGAIVAFEPNLPAVKPSDRAIAAIAGRTGGLYSMDHHLHETPGVARGLVGANIRRLEAMRRMSLVSRTSEGVFLVGEDHLKRALMYEDRLSRRFPVRASVLSYWTLEEQVQAIGPTRLDRVLAGEAAPPLGEGGFARQSASALQQRRLFLIEEGWLRPDEQVLSQSAIQRMATHELRDLAGALSHELGKAVLSEPTAQLRGVYARRIDLAQGRVALIVGDRTAHLVPWRPALERFGGREVEGLMRGQGLSWGLARTPTLGLGLGLG